jgi:hypothetical protein
MSGPGFDPLFVLADLRLRRSVFTRVPDLTQAITWAEHRNRNATPFIWKATAETSSQGKTRTRNVEPDQNPGH